MEHASQYVQDLFNHTIRARKAEIEGQVAKAKASAQPSQQIYHDEKYLIDADGTDFVLYPQAIDPDPEEDGSGSLCLHIGGESIELKSKDGFVWLEVLAEALKHIEIVDID